MTDKYFTGAVADMPNATYHQAPHIGSSGFKLLAKSPAHYWSAYVDPARQRKDPTRLMLMGTAWHTGIFEPHLFAGEYAAKPDIPAVSTVAKLLDEALTDFDAFTAKYVGIPDGISKTSKEGKALLADLAADGKTGIEQAKLAEVLELVPDLLGKTLLNADDLQAVRSMSEAARRHPHPDFRVACVQLDDGVGLLPPGFDVPARMRLGDQRRNFRLQLRDQLRKLLVRSLETLYRLVQVPHLLTQALHLSIPLRQLRLQRRHFRRLPCPLPIASALPLTPGTAPGIPTAAGPSLSSRA
jgi:hypothetical protein